jgi:translation initiation factor IF-3
VKRNPPAKKIPFDHQIRATELRVIDDTGQNLGIISRDEAIKIAHERGLSLVVVNPTANPPIGKIVDYGKMLYQEQKNERKARASAKVSEIKSVKIKFKTSPHDQETKAKQADKFLRAGQRVRVEIFLRGRERAFHNLARERVEQFLKIITEPYRTVEEIKKTPSGFTVTIAK